MSALGHEATEKPPALPAELLEIFIGYKPKKCRYCKIWSSEKSPWPLEGTALGAWAPLVAWARGTLEKPSSDLCRVCMIVPRQL